MARRARLAAALALAVVAANATAASAQTYATLHVRSFTMSVDRASASVGEAIHLTIAAHVDERVVQLDNLTLPDLSGFESLGDERRCAASPAGSDCLEIVTLAPTVAGRRTIAGATLDAIDGRNGKPSRFTTDSVTIDVNGPSFDQLGDALTGFFFGAIRAAVVFVLVVIAVFALIWGFATRRRWPQRYVSMPVPPPGYGPPPAPPPDPRARYRELVDALAHDPSRASALRVRAELRFLMNARDDETYGDLARRNTGDPANLPALAAVERAAFCEDENVYEAVMEALPYLVE